MDDRMDAVKAELEAVSFVGETLAPFFLQDPRTGTAGAAFQAVAQLRAQEAADAWPFADGAEARHALSLMVNGLADASTPTTSCGSTAVCSSVPLRSRPRPGARCTPTANAWCSARARWSCARGCARTA